MSHKLSLSLAVCAALVLGASSAQALGTYDYADFDYVGQNMTGVLSGGSWDQAIYKGYFDFKNGGDDQSIRLGGDEYKDKVGYHHEAVWKASAVFVFQHSRGDDQWDIQTIDLGEFDLVPDAIAYDQHIKTVHGNWKVRYEIEETGYMHYTIAAIKGDSKYVGGGAMIWTKKKGDPVIPEPSAVALFGIGSLLVATAIRRRQR